MGARLVTHPVNALLDREACGGVMRGKFIMKPHHAVGGRAAVTAGDRYLRGKLPAGGAAWIARLTAAGLGAHTRPEQIPVALWRQLAV